MSRKSHRDGDKIIGSHTTVIPVASSVVDITGRQPEVSGISLGYITTGLSPIRGDCRIKIGFGEDGCVLLQARGNTSKQEIRVYTSDTQTTKLAIARGARNSGLSISFEKRPV